MGNKNNKQPRAARPTGPGVGQPGYGQYPGQYGVGQFPQPGYGGGQFGGPCGPCAPQPQPCAQPMMPPPMPMQCQPPPMQMQCQPPPMQMQMPQPMPYQPQPCPPQQYDPCGGRVTILPPVPLPQYGNMGGNCYGGRPQMIPGCAAPGGGDRRPMGMGMDQQEQNEYTSRYYSEQQMPSRKNGKQQH